MPRNSRSNASSSESENYDAPESISLSRSRKDTQMLEAERRNAEVMQRRAKRDKNRDMDRKLKERAVTNKRWKGSVDKVKGGGTVVEKKKREKISDKSGEPDELEKRMRRAMKEAEDEEAELESNEEEFTGIGKDDDSTEEDDDPDYNDGSNPSGIDDDERTVTRHPDHLPDELFAAAFSSSSKRKILGDDLKLPATKKRKSSLSSSSKDIIIGSRSIRILPNSSAPPAPSTTPSKKVNKFLNRTLALKNGMQNLRTKGWERRPVNIGVLRRDGPPISFVRNK